MAIGQDQKTAFVGEWELRVEIGGRWLIKTR